MKKYFLILILLFTLNSISGQSFTAIFGEDDDNDITPPTAPVIYALSTPGDIGITSDTQTDCARMILYRGTTNDTSAMSIIDSAFTTSITKTDSPLTYNTMYYYSAKGVDASGNRSYFASVVFDTVRAVKWAGDYDGSTEYLSLSSGTSVLDLNGAEMVTKDSNSTFESGDTTDWASNGTHSIDTSSTYKYAGSYAGKVISTTTDTLQRNGTFWADTLWSKGTGITISGGVATYASGNQYPGLRQNISGMNLGAKCQITFDVASYTSGYLIITPGNGGTNIYPSTGIGTKTETFTWNGTNITLYIRGEGGSFIGSIDNVSLKVIGDTTANFISLAYNQFEPIVAGKKYTVELWLNADSTGTSLTTKPLVYGKLGSKTMWGTATDSISIYAGLFRKFAFTFLATTAEVNTPFKLYFSAARTYYMDNFSITQAKDLMVNMWIKSNSDVAEQYFLSKRQSSSAYWVLRKIDISKQWGYVFTDGTYSVNQNKTFTSASNVFKLITCIINHAGNITYYENGSALTGDSFTALGKINNTDILYLGVRAGTQNFFTGQIGEMQITTFTDIATETTWTPSALYYRTNKNAQGLNFPTSYTGGTVVFWNEWTGANITAILTSKDSYNHVMTGTNMIQSDFVEVDY